MRRFTILALALAIGLAAAASPFASKEPDGLNRVAENHGFAANATGGADYAFPGVSDPRLATGLAGFTGTLIVFGVGFSVVRLARRP
jgi:hypothetical protein